MAEGTDRPLTDPAPVVITSVDPTVEPLPVNVVSDRQPMTQPQQDESDRVTQGQRRVNLIWERTQAVMALSVVWVTLVVTAVVIVLPLLREPSGENTATVAGVGLLFGLANLVVGFYFGRTNHQRSGGVGPNEVGR